MLEDRKLVCESQKTLTEAEILRLEREAQIAKKCEQKFGADNFGLELEVQIVNEKILTTGAIRESTILTRGIDL